MKQNLTSGSVPKTVLSFSIPYLISYFLQTLYGMMDLFIIGQFNGTEGTTAVSIGSQVMHMLTVMIVGLAMGSLVLIGQAVGAEKDRETSKVIGSTITLFSGLAVVLTVILVLMVRPVVSIMSTPEEAVSGTIQYLTICFIGIPFITAYNIISSIFRGMGDSKSPMYFIAIACCANIVLDYLFIGFFHMGPAGAALGTTLAQTLSVIISLIVIIRKKLVNVSLPDLKPDLPLLKSLLKIGVPVSLQDGFIQISFLTITVIANIRGLNDAAAVGIVEKIISILFLIPSTMLQTTSALGAQNIGAGQPERAKKVLYCCILIAVSWGLAMVILMQWRAEFFVGLFSSSEIVIEMGGQYMRGYVFDCIFAGIHFCFSGYFCAIGKSGLSFLHNAVSIVLARIPLAYITSALFPDTLTPMGLGISMGSTVSVLICIIVFLWLCRKESASA